MSMEMPPVGGNDQFILSGKFSSKEKGQEEQLEVLGKQIAYKQLKTLDGAYEAASMENDTRVLLTIKDSSNDSLKQVSVDVDDLAKGFGLKEAAIRTAVKAGKLQPILATAQVRANTKSNLADFGLSPEEYNSICEYYDENRETLEALTKPTHIRKDADNSLPRSLVYNPTDPFKGLHVLCKTKGGAKEIGLGAFNRATLLLHVDTGEKKVFRNGLKEDVPETELAANRTYAAIDPNAEYYATGVAVEYTGPWRPRGAGREKNMSREELDRRIPRELDNAEKVGLIMDYIPDDELFYQVQEYTVEDRKLSQKQFVGMCLHMAKGIALAHKNGQVNLDNKPENVFMKGLTPMMADFGYTFPVGHQLSEQVGTPDYTPPEMMKATDWQPLTVTPKTEMWVTGCVIAGVAKSWDFLDWNFQRVEEGPAKYWNGQYQNALAVALATYFPNSADPDHIDHAIVKCLQWDPDDRVSAEELVTLLQNIYDKM